MRRTLQFLTGDGRKWVLTREFKDINHFRNFVDYIIRTKGYTFDEVWDVNT